MVSRILLITGLASLYPRASHCLKLIQILTLINKAQLSKSEIDKITSSNKECKLTLTLIVDLCQKVSQLGVATQKFLWLVIP